jgi:hypothetical protein
MARDKNDILREWQVPKRKQRVWSFFKIFFKPFFRVKKVEFLAEKFPDKCIIVSNHDNKKGPMVYELNLPVFHASWGAYQMLGNYSSRFHYLRDVLYIQKNGFNKFKATLKASFEAIFSYSVYKGMKILPSFPDARLRKTLQYSIDMLDAGNAVSVYPEDSNQGYFDEMTHFFPGFVMLAQMYYKKTGEDLPVFPVYYGSKKKKIVVGKPLYVQELVNQGLDRDQIADRFRLEVNQLYYDYFKENK